MHGMHAVCRDVAREVWEAASFRRQESSPAWRLLISRFRVHL